MDNYLDEPKAKAIKHNFRGGSLLIIEDHFDHWHLIQRGLQALLPEVKLIWVTTDAEALEFLQSCVAQQSPLPRLVLLDLYLPLREDGFKVLKQVKTLAPVLKRLPIVILSSSNHLDDISEAYELGASSYFTKPAQFSEWAGYFQTIFEYWGLTVTLPNGRSI